jgi:hypothetical protein
MHMQIAIVPEVEFWSRANRPSVTQDCVETTTSLDDRVKRYDLFFDILVEELQKVSSVAVKAGDEGDFSMNRYVDPISMTVVVCGSTHTAAVIGIPAAMAAIRRNADPHVVVFDSGSYIAVLPEGEIIAYSENEDLPAVFSSADIKIR